MKQFFLKYLLGNMSLSEKIGQMLMIDYRNFLEMNTDLEKLLMKYNHGGFTLFKSNIANFKQTKRLLSEIKNIGNIPVMISVDQEGGRVQRLDGRVGFKKHPPMSEIGKTNDEEIAFELGKKMGNELKSIGVDMNFAPTLDIFSNLQNKVISDRAFGNDGELVKKMGLAYADGLSSAKIIPVVKHFPGHGDTNMDSHIDLPEVDKSLDELKKLELIPFIEAIKRGIPAMMVAHISVPKLDVIPSSLSKIVIYNLLRKDLGYNGIVITDSLKMKALSRYFTNEQIYLRSIEAGNDILLMPQSIDEAHNVIYQNVNNGKISMDRIDESVYRILNIKFEYNLLNEEYNRFLQSYSSKKIR